MENRVAKMMELCSTIRLMQEYFQGKNLAAGIKPRVDFDSATCDSDGGEPNPQPRGRWFLPHAFKNSKERNSIMMTRRQVLKTTALASVAYAAAESLRLVNAQPTQGSTATSGSGGPFTLPPLPYAFDALEPYIDAETMQIHHDKHHAAYVANLNKAVAAFPDLGKKPVEDLLKDLNAVPEKVRTTVRNNGGGHYNHSMFWQMMKKNAGGEPSGELSKAIVKNFGSFGAFKSQFEKAALGQFGSGWAWLVSDGGNLKIESTPNQDSPISEGRQPLLGLDVWEHAYYLKHQNRRPEYIASWFNVINWDYVSQRL